MVSEKRVSVAMATFCGQRFLREQLDSILEQLTDEDELVLSDDGSTDGTREILEEYAGSDDRIRVLDGPRRGVKKNFEHAILNCRGNYIFLADQDDIWKPDKVRRVLRAFQEQGCRTVIHDAEVFSDEPGAVTPDSFFAFRDAGPGVLKNWIKNGYIGCCMAFCSELTGKILPIPEQIEMHDQWIGIISDFYYGKTVFLREPLLCYRRHGGNQSGMEPYGPGKRIRNRLVFLTAFLKRILKIS